MIRPRELQSDNGRDIWDTITAATPGEDHPIHQAAQADDVVRVRELLDAEPTLVNRSDRAGGTPLHRAVLGSARRAIALLLDRGADIHAVHSVARGASGGWWAVD